MGRRGSTGAISGLANFMPRVVGRLVMQPDAPSVPGERDRVISLIRSLDAYSLMPALKGIMVSLTGDAAWLRVRAPLVALTPAQLAAIGQVVREFSLDLAKD
jgi:4-hydroxy-tetrahydrodipicolinate synthase